MKHQGRKRHPQILHKRNHRIHVKVMYEKTSHRYLNTNLLNTPQFQFLPLLVLAQTQSKLQILQPQNLVNLQKLLLINRQTRLVDSKLQTAKDLQLFHQKSKIEQWNSKNLLNLIQILSTR